MENLANGHEMHEACVEIADGVDIPEGQPVAPVEVGVATKHLLVHVLDLSFKALWKT